MLKEVGKSSQFGIKLGILGFPDLDSGLRNTGLWTDISVQNMQKSLVQSETQSLSLVFSECHKARLIKLQVHFVTFLKWARLELGLTLKYFFKSSSCLGQI